MIRLGLFQRGRPNPGVCPGCGHKNPYGYGTMQCDACGAEISEDPLKRGMIAHDVAAVVRRARRGPADDLGQFRLEARIMGVLLALAAVVGGVWLLW